MVKTALIHLRDLVTTILHGRAVDRAIRKMSYGRIDDKRIDEVNQFYSLVSKSNK